MSYSMILSGCLRHGRRVFLQLAGGARERSLWSSALPAQPTCPPRHHLLSRSWSCHSQGAWETELLLVLLVLRVLVLVLVLVLPTIAFQR